MFVCNKKRARKKIRLPVHKTLIGVIGNVNSLAIAGSRQMKDAGHPHHLPAQIQTNVQMEDTKSWS